MNAQPAMFASAARRTRCGSATPSNITEMPASSSDRATISGRFSDEIVQDSSKPDGATPTSTTLGSRWGSHRTGRVWPVSGKGQPPSLTQRRRRASRIKPAGLNLVLEVLAILPEFRVPPNKLEGKLFQFELFKIIGYGRRPPVLLPFHNCLPSTRRRGDWSQYEGKIRVR